ncbi:ATP-dependent RNA helicase DDX50-like [Ruditapes philippinarum]|uniref:ATP-dependent RNA helicase DDX50-like n=1 Tax=Ruditapes philippinarum TaxID=129788 RepID=UPI00295B24E5|nr:ATP-dependent RNA helicase DDX50-like [Ruditapes philippinarum]
MSKMATREIMRMSGRLNVLKKFQLISQGTRALTFQRGLHKVVQPNHGAVIHKQWPMKQCRTAATYEYSEVEKTQDVDGDFDKYDISDVTQKKLRKMGIEKLLPVQYHTYGPTIEGKDVIVQARTGTGKTLSFAIPIVEKLEQNKHRLGGTKRIPLVIVLTPTRELANQIKEVFESLCDKARVTCVYGGVNIEKQINSLRNGADVIVGTPGRVYDLMNRNELVLTDLQHVILDEVDRMLDMGFDEQVEKIIIDSYQSANKPQTMLYSATMPSWVRNAARKYLDDDYELISLIGKNSEQTATTVKQYAIKCMVSQKPSLITYFVKNFCQQTGRAIVFCETKMEVNQLTGSELIRRSRAFHGDISQASRDLILKDFKKGDFQVLVTTDVAARGLDIPNIDVVIQSSPPNDTNYYIHRVGRTGRAGNTGVSILMYTKQEENEVHNLERKAKTPFEQLSPPTLDDFMAVCEKDVTKELQSVPDELINHFMERADILIQKEGAQKMLAASLALASGAKQFFFRSLITYQEGFTTLLYKGDRSDNRHVQEKVRRYFEKMNVKYQNVPKIWSLVFDVKAEDARIVLEGFDDVRSSNSESIEQVRELPDINSVHRFTMPRKHNRYSDRHGSFRRHGNQGWLDRNEDGMNRYEQRDRPNRHEQRDRPNFRGRFNDGGRKFDFDRNSGYRGSHGKQRRQEFEWDDDDF